MTEPRFPHLEWHEAAEAVEKCIVEIETPSALGTGFVISMVRPQSPDNRQTHGIIIGTAWHVVANFYREKRGNLRLIRSGDRVDITTLCDNVAILPIMDEVYDCGVIICTSQEPLFSIGDLLPLLPNDVMLRRGAEIAWMGFPALFEKRELCFFSGHISGYVPDPPTYLVDGVAINGVSGGPAFDNRKHLIGFVSAYIPNHLNEDMTLPGLSSIIPISLILNYLEGHLGVRRI